MKDLRLGTALIVCALGVSVLNIDVLNANAAPVSNAKVAETNDGPGGEAPTLKITGKAKGTYHNYRNGKSVTGDVGSGTLFAVEDSRLDFISSGRMDTGWTGKTFFSWTLGVTGNTGVTQNIEENKLLVRNQCGTLMFGNYQGVENFMARGAFGVMGATGGFDGNYGATIKNVTGVYSGTDMTSTTKYSTKLSYVTPRFQGVQFGVSYTPNSEHKGAGRFGAPLNRTSTKTPAEAFDLNSLAFGLNYVKKLTEDFSLALSATAITGKTRPPVSGGFDQTNLYTAYSTAARHRTKSYALGGVASYKKFELGAEWINNGKSRQIKNASSLATAAAAGANPYAGTLGDFNGGKAFSVATSYTLGFNKFAYGYYTSKAKFNGQNTKINIHSVTYDRALAPGFSLFAEGVAFDQKSTASSVAFQNSLRTNYAGASAGTPSSGLLKNRGRSILMGASTKF